MPRTLPLLSRTQAPGPDTSSSTRIPTIRLTSATPSPSSSAADNASYSVIAPFSSSPLAPRSESEAPRKRVVPKKSKLGLLGGGSKSKDKNAKDFSDVARRLGESESTGRGGFEIYVDHADDPDLEEVVVVKKKKSRMALDGMKWGALGEVTNVPATTTNKPVKHAPVEHLLKVKGEDSQKWWSIGRGRKDSKEKSKDKEQENMQPRSKTPDPFKPVDNRARFNSLDSGILLTSAPAEIKNQGTVSSVQTLLTVPPRETASATTEVSNGLLAAPPAAAGPATGSIAIRAMRSMRSIARMTSWAQLTNANDKEGNASTNATTVPGKTKEKEKSEGKKKKKKDKDEKKEKSKEKERTLRYSGSSFEAGALSAQGSPAPPPRLDAVGDIKKKQSMLGLGLPSTMRLAATRSTSTCSSVSGVPGPQPNRLSVDSAHLILNAQGRPSSTLSSGSSLRPPSTASGISAFSARSGRSSSSSVVSVRWDEEGLQTVKEMQRQERRTRRAQAAKSTGGERDSRKSSEGRRRPPIAEIFPEVQGDMQRSRSVSPPASVVGGPIVKVEEATADGHSDHGDEPAIETPVKKARARPVSEQLLGKTRPKAICDEADGVISILDAATNDLASLIGRLDLEATPASTPGSPFRRTPTVSGSPSRVPFLEQESPVPVKRRIMNRDAALIAELRESMASISSLRPYAQAQARAVPGPSHRQQPYEHATLIGQQIAPWPALDWQVSPKKASTKKNTGTFRPTHRRTLTPAPAVEPSPVFQPLRPAKTKIAAVVSTASSPRVATPPVVKDGASPSSHTFGSESKCSRLGKRFSHPDAPSPTPVFKRAGGHSRMDPVLSTMGQKDSQGTLRATPSPSGMPITPAARESLGMGGTLGGSASTEPPVDPEDPESDIPDELQEILSGQSDEETTRSFDDTLSFRPPSPGMPPLAPLPAPEPANLTDAGADAPVFRAQLYDEEANQGDIDEGGGSSCGEDDTKKSFDFTGELQKLNESGASDRLSFVEQLESAFRTPAHVGYGLDFDDRFLQADVPPLPALPIMHRTTPPEGVAPRSISSPEITTTVEESSAEMSYQDAPEQDTLDRLLAECDEDNCQMYSELQTSPCSMRSKASDGQLNIDFKFGGKPGLPESVPEERTLLTLSDIIPPLSHSQSYSHSRSQSLASVVEEDSSLLDSIMEKAAGLPSSVPRVRLDSDSGSKRNARAIARAATSPAGTHSRSTSSASFTGFESFEEVRRGFEFGPSRPAFYPPPGASRSHGRHESIYSIASVSSYGDVVHSGSLDPFGYALSRPPSFGEDSMSMSMSVDDTFSFIRKDRLRQRVDSDASSFYFRTSGPSQASHPYRRSHRRGESTLSVASNAPPVSLYNRSFGGHRRNDSSGSTSSVALSYAMHGAHGGRAAWARHRPDPSVESVMSDYSAMRLGRPGLGDKMFETEQGMPLTAISGSPAESQASGGDHLTRRLSFDSILDLEQRPSLEDSLFERTGYRTSIGDESVFGDVSSYAGRAGQLPAHQFRPLSVFSIASVHSIAKEDDTMISMLGGGHVRRRSIDSLIEASPCVRIERRHHARAQNLGRVIQFERRDDDVDMDVNPTDSATKARLIEKPSIASTSSHQFGGERMIMARKGLLERQSLEDSALMAQGEDLLASLRSSSIFSRPGPAARSRSSTVTSSSGGETPPLSSSDGSSISGGSQSSIDLGHLNSLLTSASFQSAGLSRARSRARARGTGHRRRITEARASRSSVYETIEEESYVLSSSPSPAKPSLSANMSQDVTSTMNSSIFVVDGDSDSIMTDWNDERGITTMRRYFALKDEVHVTVEESKRTWMDTPFSVFALQSFQPPANKGGMQAMLEHSQKNYGPLPSELRPHRIRSRTSSRPSPYPLRVKASLSPEQTRLSDFGLSCDLDAGRPFASSNHHSALREVTTNPNITIISPPPSIDVKPFTPFAVELDKSKLGKDNLGLPARPRVTSSARRTALGWSKRSTGKSSSNDNKENIGQGMVIVPTEGLRLSRPRPRGRPNPGRVPMPPV